MSEEKVMLLLHLVKEFYPVIWNAWDRYDYLVSGPLSLDDEPQVVVVLINKNGRRDTVRFNLTAKERDLAPTVTR